MSPTQSATGQLGWGFHTQRGGIHPGGFVFVPGLLELYRYGRIFSGDETQSPPGAAGPRRWLEGQPPTRAGSMSPSQSATSQRGCGLHTLWGGIDPGDLYIRPRVVGVVEIRRDF